MRVEISDTTLIEPVHVSDRVPMLVWFIIPYCPINVFDTRFSIFLKYEAQVLDANIEDCCQASPYRPSDLEAAWGVRMSEHTRLYDST